MKAAEMKRLLDDCKKKGVLPGFAISRMPVSLFEQFMVDIEENYSGTYWVKLKELMWKAAAFDAIMSGQASVAVPVQPENEVQQPEEKEDASVVRTIGDVARGR